MSDLTLQRADSHTYDVYFVVPGSPRFVWRIATHGITLSDSGIAYTVNDSPRTAAFTEIAAIHLSTAALGNASSVIDQCKIEFNNGSTIAISNAAANGLPKDAQTRIYRDFVRDLHGRLVASGHDTIALRRACRRALQRRARHHWSSPGCSSSSRHSSLR